MEVIDPRRGDRTLLPLEQIPVYMREATIALEDKTFYQNMGVDPMGIAPRLSPEPPGPTGPGRQLDHRAAGQEHHHPRGRALRQIVRAQDQGGHSGRRDLAPLLQGPDPGVVSEHQLLRQLGLRRRGGRPGLLWQARPGAGPGRVRHAGPHRPVPGHEPDRQPRRGQEAAKDRPHPPGRRGLYHPDRGRCRLTPSRCVSTLRCSSGTTSSPPTLPCTSASSSRTSMARSFCTKAG